MGDSISTFTGWMPEGYGNGHYPRNDSGVTTDDKTWWMELANALGMDVLVTDSKGGTRVSTFGGETTLAGCTDERVSKLAVTRHGKTIDPEVIIVYMGINDFNYGDGVTPATPLGDYTGKTAVPETTDTFSAAYGVMLSKICTSYPTAQIYVCTLPQCEHTSPTVFPEINGNGVALEEFNERIRTLANAFGVRVLDHHSAGIKYYNLDMYTHDLTHFNAAGMALLANNDIWQLDSAIRKRYE